MSNILDDIEKYKETYYAENKKNTFFKKDQKMEIASKISTEFNLSILFHKTVYILNETNHIYLDYNYFKMFAHPSNYVQFVEYTHAIIATCVKEFGNFVVHLNINTFTASAAERYKAVFEIFNSYSERMDSNFTFELVKLHVYNAPSSMDHIYKLLVYLIEPGVRDKIVFYNKAESLLTNPVK